MAKDGRMMWSAREGGPRQCPNKGYVVAFKNTGERKMKQKKERFTLR